MSDPNDIRRFFSPPRNANTQRQQQTTANTANTPEHNPQTPMQRNWRNNRRIIESDDEADLQPDTRASNADIPAITDIAEAQHRDVDAPILIHTSDDDDDIWVRPPNNRETRRGCNVEDQTQTQHVQRRHDAPKRGRRWDPEPPARRRGRQRCRYEEEAEESSDASSDDVNECVESDSVAEDLYRSAVAGVRNAQISRQHWRATTTPCPICAKFASYLQHFL